MFGKLRGAVVSAINEDTLSVDGIAVDPNCTFVKVWDTALVSGARACSLSCSVLATVRKELREETCDVTAMIEDEEEEIGNDEV